MRFREVVSNITTDNHLTDDDLRIIAPDVEGAPVDMDAVRKLEKALKMDSHDRNCLEHPLTTEQMERWRCGICSEMATNPMLLSCGHYFCGRCICTWGLLKIKQGLVTKLAIQRPHASLAKRCSTRRR